MSEGTTAADRITAALKDKTRGWRGPDHGKMQGKVRLQHLQHVALAAGDVAEVTGAIKDKSEITQSQFDACSKLDPETEVVIYADHAFLILDELAVSPTLPLK